MRLIDADALMEEVNIEIREYMLTEKGMRSLIRNAPTIDAVEVVRCDDCRLRYMDADLQVWTCTYGLMIKPNGFCNYGERRGESR